MYTGLHVKYPPFFSEINVTWIFSTDYRKNTQISNFIQIRPVAAELSHANRRTDGHDEANSRFSQFCERVYKQKSCNNFQHYFFSYYLIL